MAEFKLIEQIVAFFSAKDGTGDLSDVVVGVGDDAAEFASGYWPLVATDTMVETIHFDRRFSSGADVGFKLLAANVSDIVAMGGSPGPFLLNLTLPSDPSHPSPQDWTAELLRGLEAARTAHGLGVQVRPIGGDTTRANTGGAVLTLTLFGRPRGATSWRRAGAGVGDDVWVSGPLGLAALGLAALELDRASDRRFRNAVRRHRRPLAPIQLAGQLTADAVVTAAIDVSDGLASDLGHICRASNRIGANVSLDRLPPAGDAADLASELGLDWLSLQVAGGDDYELLFCALPNARARLDALGLSRIGVMTAEPGLRWFQHDSEIDRTFSGYEHFK